MPPIDKKDDEGTSTTTATVETNDAQKKPKDDDESGTPALSEEDLELKERLDTCVGTVLNADHEPSVTVPLRLQALDLIVRELRTATASMTSVPKPLKFLRRHFGVLKELHGALGQPNEDNGGGAPDDGVLLFRARLADVLAVLAMTLGTADGRESLHFKLEGVKDYEKLSGDQSPSSSADDDDNLGSWGHEFVRSLAGEIGQEYNQRVVDGADPGRDEPFADLWKMVDVIVPFHIQHNAEAEAVDLLIETQRLSQLRRLTNDLVDDTNYRRICQYLVKTADFQSDPDDLYEMLDTAFHLYKSQDQYHDALRVALRLWNTSPDYDEATLPAKLLSECADGLVKRQMCFLLARHRVALELDNDEEEDEEELNDILGNAHLSEHFLKLAQDLDVMDAKTPEDIYKSHLAEVGGFSRTRRMNGTGGAQVDSARANLASTFVNAFVNAGFGHDKRMTVDDEWLYKNRDHGMMSAAASLGLIHLWNVDEGLSNIDKYLYSTEEHVKAGAALAVGVLSSGVRNDADPALALLAEHVDGTHTMRCAACTGFGIAYAGAGREEVMDLLLPLLEETTEDQPTNRVKEIMLEVSLAGLALGMIYVGKCDDTIGGAILQRLMEATTEELDLPHTKFLVLGLGLLFLGRMEKADAVLEALKTIEHASFSRYASVVLETCAYAGTGNVLKVQAMLHHCTQHLTEDADYQMAAVMGIGIVTMGEDVGMEMALRTFDHLLHYCEPPIKRSVPLALAVLHASNPEYPIVDQLSRLSHDPDTELSQNAILALGLVGAGTNNSRVAGLLRQLSEFYSREAGHVFCVRLAQGFLHMGKGLLSINPFHSDRMLYTGPGVGALLVVLTSCLHLSDTLLDKTHYLLYYLTCALNPRMLVTVSAEDPSVWKPVTARVGQAVETVGQAGKPRTITGFQTHTTPVLLAVKERAELGTEEFLSVSSVLEGVVIVKENPDYVKENDEGK